MTFAAGKLQAGSSTCPQNDPEKGSAAWWLILVGEQLWVICAIVTGLDNGRIANNRVMGRTACRAHAFWPGLKNL